MTLQTEILSTEIVLFSKTNNFFQLFNSLLIADIHEMQMTSDNISETFDGAICFFFFKKNRGKKLEEVC